jgi:REP element-mobilizing transposase RayT
VAGYWPFTDVDREKMFEVVGSACRYFLIEPVSMTMMGNHFHIVLYIPDINELPADSSVAGRHDAFFAGRRPTFGHGNDDESERLESVKREMVDLSEFMKRIQQSYTTYYNRAHERRGKLWADRFKSTILEGETALWSCVKYIELNPVRAKLVADSADYRFCSWGRYKGSGTHPFAASFERHMKAAHWGGAAESADGVNVYDEFEGELLRTVEFERQEESGRSGEEIMSEVEAVKSGKRRESMPLRFLRRTRHWADGAIIGSKAFVQETGCLFREKEAVLRHKLSRGSDPTISLGSVIYCYRQL